MDSSELRLPSEGEVLEAAARIVDAFAATDTERYFSAFAPESSFIFHTEQHQLRSREAYEQLWADWVSDGWSVVSCTSSNQQVTVFPGGAVFSHEVATTARTRDGDESYRERETIVFRRDGNDRLIAIHEHLSPTPASAE